VVTQGLCAVLRSRSGAVLLLMLAAGVYFSLSQPRFFSSANLQVLLSSASILWFVSIGLTFVMLTGGIDLSMGSFLALSGVAFGAFHLDIGVPVAPAIVLTLVFGFVVGGVVNGLLVGRMKLLALVVTLGTLILYRGVVDLWSKAETRQTESKLLDSLAFDSLLGLPVPVCLMLLTLALSAYVLRSTYFGRDVYAVGGSADAARLSGIRVPRTIASVYAIAGALAALAGVMQVARIAAVSPSVGTNIIFDATAAVLLGGTSFVGGIGGVGGTAVGVLFLATLQNGLAAGGLNSAWQQVISGTILIVALIVDMLRTGGWFDRARSLRENVEIGERGGPAGEGPTGTAATASADA
jgi:ribose/xylose/arabinose/galactoside ABC-type transport system permease subunit